MNPLDVHIAPLIKYEDEATLVALGRAVEKVRGIDFLHAVQMIFDGYGGSGRNGGPATVRDALWSLSEDELKAVEGEAQLIEWRDEDIILDRAQRLQGVRTFTASTEKGYENVAVVDDDLDVAAALLDPLERERRWRRAEKILDHIDHFSPPIITRQEWEIVDKAELNAGRDVLVSAEINAERAAAKRENEEYAKQLDKAIAERRASDMATVQHTIKTLERQLAVASGKGSARV